MENFAFIYKKHQLQAGGFMVYYNEIYPSYFRG